MRKKLLCIGLLTISCIVVANIHGQSLGFDRYINDHASRQLDAPDMAIAFDGRIYNAHRSGNDITIKVSQDHGKTWQPFQSLSMPGYSYDAPSIIVTGNNPGNLALFVAGVRRAVKGAEKTIFVRKYNIESQTFTEPFSQSVTGELYSCDLAGSGASSEDGFSISLLYAARFGNRSVLLQKVSVDGGNTFPISHTVASSREYYRNVSISYGKSHTASNGRYFMAWDEYATPWSAWGHVYASRNAATALSATVVPMRIDNTDPETAGRLRHPVISVSNTIDNDSASCTAIILAEHNRSGDGSTISIAGFSNQRAHFTGYWRYTTVAENGVQPALAFNPATLNFAASYYNAKEQSIHLLKTDFRVPSSGNWESVVSNYADLDALSDPKPCIAIDPVYEQAAMSWSVATQSHAICFDAEYNKTPAALQEINAINQGNSNKLSWIAGDAADEGTVIVERSTDGRTFTTLATVSQKGNPFINSYNDQHPGKGTNYYRIKYAAGYSAVASAYADLITGDATIAAYPNPATRHLYLVTPDAAADAMVMLYSIDGKVCLQAPATAGLTTIDISKLPAGAYLMQYTDGNIKKSGRITKVSL